LKFEVSVAYNENNDIESGGKEMKEYKVVFLNKGLKFSREKDIDETENTINEYASQGWELQQVVSPNDLGGAMIGIFYKEK